MILDIKETDVWQALAQSEKPVVIYGMGNAAERIITILRNHGISVSDIFASDEFVRGHSFLGYKVLKYSEVCEKYSDFNIVLAFATHIDSVLDRIKKMSAEHQVYAPDIPVAGDGIFTGKYFEENREKFEYVFSRLADEESRRVYRNIIRFKISGKVEYLYSSTEYSKDSIYRNILHLNGCETIIDCGAYDGDTIREITGFTGNSYRRIHALEPDKKNFRKLCRSTEGMQAVSLYNIGVWEKQDKLIFSGKAGRNSKLSSEGDLVCVSDLDSLINDAPTLIKMDIEGAELKALAGCKRLISEYSPKLYICAYHRNEDMFSLPIKIWEYNENYKIYFRHSPYIPAWESNFYCTV